MAQPNYNRNMYLDRRILVNGITPTTLNLENFFNLREYTQWLLDNNYITIPAGAVDGCIINEVTYSELITLIETSGLEECQLYILTDYQTIYDRPDYDVDGNPVATLTTVTVDAEPLLIRAISSNQIDSNVKSLTYPEDDIYYIPYDEGIPVTPVMGVETKGLILWRHDKSYDTRYPYDWRGMTWKRYESSLGSGDYTSYKDTGGAADYFPTFAEGGGVGVHVDIVYETETNPTGLPNNVFFSEVFDLKAGALFMNNTFGYKTISNEFAILSSGNLFLEECSFNKFSSWVIGLIANNTFKHNTFLGKVAATGFADICIHNLFTDNVGIVDENSTGYENTFLGVVAYNRIGLCIGNTCSSRVVYNTFEKIFSNNVLTGILSYCSSPIFSDNDITVPDYTSGGDATIYLDTLGFSFNIATEAITNNTIFPRPIFQVTEDPIPSDHIFKSLAFIQNSFISLAYNNIYYWTVQYNDFGIINNNNFGQNSVGRGCALAHNKIDFASGNTIQKRALYYNEIYYFNSNNIYGSAGSQVPVVDDYNKYLFGQFSFNNLKYLSAITFNNVAFSSNTNDSIQWNDILTTLTNTTVVFHNINSGKGLSVFEYYFTAGNSGFYNVGELTAGSSVYGGVIPKGATPIKAIIFNDGISGNALAELEVGIDVDDTTYGFASMDITTIPAVTIVNLGSNTCTDDRQIKLTAAVDTITTGKIKVIIEWI